MIDWTRAIELGYDPVTAGTHDNVITANGTISAKELVLVQIEAVSLRYTNFPILCHPLEAGTGVDGVLGLDFLRGHKLTLDFRSGILALE